MECVKNVFGIACICKRNAIIWKNTCLQFFFLKKKNKVARIFAQIFERMQIQL